MVKCGLLMVLLFALITGSAMSGVANAATVEAIQYVEGLNDWCMVHPNAVYSGIWYGIQYTPTVSYNLKKVELMAGLGTGNFIIQLRPDSAGYPSNTILRSTSFTMANTMSWQGTEFAQAYPLNAGSKYWIVFSPVPNSRASIAGGGCPGWVPITAVTSASSTGPWQYVINIFTGQPLPWMARFYEETAGKTDTQIDFQFGPSPAKPGETVELYGTLKDVYDNPVYPAQVGVEYSTNGGATWHYIWTLSTNWAGEFSKAFSAPGVGEYLVRVSYGGSATYNPSSHTEPLIVQIVWGDYHFHLSPFVDVLHLKISGKVIYGICDAATYHNQPVLGWIEGGSFYLFIDWTEDDFGNEIYYELAMLRGSVSTLSGSMYRTVDGTSWDGPTSFSLVSASSSSKSSTGKASASAVEPESWPPTLHFQISPFLDVVHLSIDGSVLHGQCDATTYHDQPVLGYVSGNFFIFAIDYTEDDFGNNIYYELSITAGSVSTKSGNMYRIVDGKSWDGPTAINLVSAPP